MCFDRLREEGREAHAWQILKGGRGKLLQKDMCMRVCVRVVCSNMRVHVYIYMGM